MGKTWMFVFCCVFYPGCTYGMSTWHKACPGSYGEWNSIADQDGIKVVQYAEDKLTLKAVDEEDLALGYQPGQEYPLNLRLHPDHKLYSHFQLVTVSDGQCGTGSLRTDHGTGEMSQIFCTHSVVNLTKHHLTIYWQAPECGCVTFLPGAYTSAGELIIGVDTGFQGHQGQTFCLAAEHLSNEIDTLDQDPEDNWDHVFDPGFYGFNNIHNMLEDKDMIKNEIEAIKEIYDLGNDLDLNEDEQDEVEFDDTEESAVEEINGGGENEDDQPCSDEECTTEKDQKNWRRKHRQNKRKKWQRKNKNQNEQDSNGDDDDEHIDKELRDEDEDSDHKFIKERRNQHRKPHNKGCKGRFCGNQRMNKKEHHVQRMNKVTLPQKLCGLALDILPIKENILSLLGSRKPDWIQRWRSWRMNAGICCNEAGSAEMGECIKTLGPFPLPWKRQQRFASEKVSPEKKLSFVCQRVSQFSWEHFSRRPRIQKFNEDRRVQIRTKWEQRRQEIMDCCQVSIPDDRIECVEDVQSGRMDQACQDYPADHQHHGPARGIRGSITKKCCRHEDDDRYNCFKKHQQNKMLPRNMMGRKTNESNETETDAATHKSQPWRPTRPQKGTHGASKRAQMARLRNGCCREGKKAAIGIHQRRWQACNRSGISYVDSQENLNGFMSRMCKLKVRRCCLKAYHTTVVDEPTTTTALPVHDDNNDPFM